MESILGKAVWVLEWPASGEPTLRQALVLSTAEPEGIRLYENRVSAVWVEGDGLLRVVEPGYGGGPFAGYLKRVWLYSLEQIHPKLRARLEVAGQWPKTDPATQWREWMAAQVDAFSGEDGE